MRGKLIYSKFEFLALVTLSDEPPAPKKYNI